VTSVDISDLARYWHEGCKGKRVGCHDPVETAGKMVLYPLA
jgi:hypothetical protein